MVLCVCCVEAVRSLDHCLAEGGTIQFVASLPTSRGGGGGGGGSCWKCTWERKLHRCLDAVMTFLFSFRPYGLVHGDILIR